MRRVLRLAKEAIPNSSEFLFLVFGIVFVVYRSIPWDCSSGAFFFSPEVTFLGEI